MLNSDKKVERKNKFRTERARDEREQQNLCKNKP
jgi:hypothetical protein